MHPGPTPSTQQSPPTQLPQASPSTASAQSALHTSLQHAGSCAHTQDSTASSLQPGPLPSTQQAPTGGG